MLQCENILAIKPAIVFILTVNALITARQTIHIQKHPLGRLVMKEERRQNLLEHYGIGVMKTWPKPKDGSNRWFGVFQIDGGDYETDDFPTRRQAEDQAIADYESICETGTK